jgi:hypothetical protein
MMSREYTQHIQVEFTVVHLCASAIQEIPPWEHRIEIFPEYVEVKKTKGRVPRKCAAEADVSEN